jgi:hypothetical protein
VSQQLGDACLPERCAGQVLVEPVGEVETPLVAQPHHLYGNECLRNRADPILRVRRIACDGSAPGRPHRRALANDRPDDRRNASLGLRPRDPMQQSVLGGGQQLVGHG